MGYRGRCALAGAIVLGAFSISAAGCGLVSSRDVRTDEIWAVLIVDQDADGHVEAQALLREGGPLGRVVDLGAGEHVTCNGVQLGERYDPVTLLHWSIGSVPEDAAGRYDLTLVRTDGEVSSTVHMGAVPTVTETEPATSLSRTEPLTVRWDATEPGDGVQINVEGPCVASTSQLDAPDVGEYTFDRLPEIGVEPCTITVTVIRKTMGLVAAAFAGGYTQANRRARTSLTLRP